MTRPYGITARQTTIYSTNRRRNSLRRLLLVLLQQMVQLIFQFPDLGIRICSPFQLVVPGRGSQEACR